MTTKEKIVRQAIKKVSADIKKLETLLYSSPLTDIIKLRIESVEQAKKMTGIKAICYLKEQGVKEKALFQLAKKQRNCIKLSDRIGELGIELSDLNNELHLIELKKLRQQRDNIEIIVNKKAVIL